MSFAYLHECFPDPTKTFVYREVVAMADLGMAPLVFSIRRPSDEEQARMESLNVSVHYLPPEPELRATIEKERESFSRAQRRALSHWRAQKGDSTRIFEALWLGRELRRRGICHVHAHFGGMASRTAWLVRELWGIPFSFTGHADDIFSPEKKPISLEMLVKAACFIATETDYSRQRLENEFPAARAKTFRIFNGIVSAEENGDGSLPERQGTTSVPKIVSVGRLVEKKGFPDLLRICAVLRDRGVAFTCDIIGGGPLETELRKQCTELRLTGRVEFHGAQPQTFVRAKLAEARVFVLAAREEGDGGSDNLPTVIMEAMQAGLPVVSTRLAGIPEMIDDGVSGRLLDAGNIEVLSAAVKSYLEDEAISREHGSIGRVRVRERFDVKNSARELARLLVEKAGVVPPATVSARDSALRPRTSFLRRMSRLWRGLVNRV